MTYKVILVQFPLSETDYVKVRPALCLTKPTGQFNHVLISFITSVLTSKDEKLITDILVPKSEETGLKQDSTIRLHKITNIALSSTTFQFRQIGQLPQDLIAQTKQKLREYLGL